MGKPLGQCSNVNVETRRKPSHSTRERLKGWPVKRVKVYALTFVEDGDWRETAFYRPHKYKFICLRCFQRGLIRHTSGKTMLCRKHSTENAHWRRRNSLPPLREVGGERRETSRKDEGHG